MNQKPKRVRIRKPKVEYFHWKDFDPAKMPRDAEPWFVEGLTKYRDLLPDLLKRQGEFVVIHGEDVQVFPDQDSAVTYALKTYWPEQVFIKEIMEKQRIESLGGAAL